ncbi:alkylation response protein AidB-like acyl-CoA dehydrogenase [Antricoccus suffuscus]|uniref:Acyl-[acyl-carrier-protein] dehydrogenase MbtN n=1 Tax=Antricoccus suffuscus TaxID=1629062 RepID=A0A2T1A4U6_9ACTN|nr:acyl-CoA dehydrogenase family protein [Antricoccus suffuscus]PRZ43620.1 alkylation response protein AidB-like acyl-CoA dehydrogenase [Antricoccus suffuscus]
MKQNLYESEHDAFRDTVRTFLEKNAVPFHAQWAKDGQVDREVWRAAGSAGLLGTDVPEEFGGGGQVDFRFNAVVGEEVNRAGVTGLGLTLHNDVVAPYLLHLGTAEQKKRWLPGFCSGDLITAIAMTEPGTGSDLQAVRTTAKRDGTDFVINGSKIFITNGILSDLVIVVARTNEEASGSKALSLIVVERDTPGFSRGRNLDKVGLKAQDTAELFFDNVRVPQENLLGELDRGFVHLMNNLPQERLTVAVAAVASSERMLELTLDYAKSRHAFGQPIGSFQNTRFELAEMATEIQIARVFLNEAIRSHNDGEYTAVDASAGKWWTTDLQKRVADRCLQLHGGYGYMTEYPISQFFLDARVQPIYAGTNEIMKEIVGRSLGV